MKAIALLAVSAFLSSAAIGLAPAVHADDDAKINARIASAGRACKNAVAVKYPKYSMADISVELGRTMQEGVDAGQITLKDIKSNGLSFNWTVKKHAGYCNTDGSGNVTELRKN